MWTTSRLGCCSPEALKPRRILPVHMFYTDPQIRKVTFSRTPPPLMETLRRTLKTRKNWVYCRLYGSSFGAHVLGVDLGCKVCSLPGHKL